MLGVPCFSLVPVLRCVAFGRIEFSTLLIPPGVELIFSITLLFRRDDKRRRYHLLLCAEGISYFLLALIDFLTHIVTVFRQDLSVVKIIDLMIGALSVVPLLCFTLWFFFAAQEELLHVIPTSLRKLTKYFLVCCIPLVVISNAIGAFLGMSYRTLDGAITVGFVDERSRSLWSLFNMLSLALLAVFEVVAFSLLFARLIKVIRHKKQWEVMSGTGEVYRFRGVIFMNLGMMLSLAETLAGFAPQSFTLAITRRGTKSAGRILIILGLLKGWDCLEEVRFVLREPSKLKRISKLSIRQLFPNIRSQSDQAQTSERNHERVSVRHPRGRAPTLHLRLSEFDINPVIKAFRSPTSSSHSFQTHLIPQTPPTASPVDAVTGHLDLRSPHHRKAPSDVPISPLTPNSPWTITAPTPRASSSNRTASPRPSAPTQDEHYHHPTHTRGNTLSSTLSHLQVEVMTISESPPDPGFVLPIPSRSEMRQNFGWSLNNPKLVRGSMYHTRTTEREYAEDFLCDYGYSQPGQEGLFPPPLDPPRPRQPSWVSESSDMSSAVISTATRLTRANTSVSLASPATRRSPAVMSDGEGHQRQRTAAVSQHLLDRAPPPSQVERPAGDTV